MKAAEILKQREAKVLNINGDAPQPLSEVRAEQVAKSNALLDRDISRAPRWTWSSLDRMTGAMMPGELVIVGALMANGKSSLLMSQMDAFAAANVSTLYIPLEIDPEINRLRWAAWRLNIDVRHAIRQEWALLPKNARESIGLVLQEQQANQFINFASPKRITIREMYDVCKQAVEETGCKVVMLDHFHRMDFGASGDQRVTATDFVRRLKDMARHLGIVLIAAAQLNRSNDPIDAYTAPGLARLKETSGLGEEADVVLMLSRMLKRNLPQGWANDLRLGNITELDIAEPNVMHITCRKHRLDDSAMNRGVSLTVANGRLFDRETWGNTEDRRNIY